MDSRLRDLERRASSGDPEALLSWVRARRRLDGQAAPQYSEGVAVEGELLGSVLQAALAVMGRREIEILRDAEFSEANACRYIRAFRDLAGGRARAWVWVVRWTRLLPVVELEDLASVTTLSRPT